MTEKGKKNITLLQNNFKHTLIHSLKHSHILKHTNILSHTYPHIKFLFFKAHVGAFEDGAYLKEVWSLDGYLEVQGLKFKSSP